MISNTPKLSTTCQRDQRQRELASTMPSMVVIPMVPATAAP